MRWWSEFDPSLPAILDNHTAPAWYQLAFYLGLTGTILSAAVAGAIVGVVAARDRLPSTMARPPQVLVMLAASTVGTAIAFTGATLVTLLLFIASAQSMSAS